MDDGDCSVNVEVEPDVILDVDENSNDSDEYLKPPNRFENGIMPTLLDNRYNIEKAFTTAFRAAELNFSDQNPPPLEQCSHCGKYYRRLARHMQKHMRAADGYLQQVAAAYHLNNDKFTKDALLATAHIKTHTEVILKPFVCEVCKKAFSQNCNLINHLRVHTGDKPFKCHLCDKRFTQSGNLKNHLRLHNDEKPYVCSICYQAFRQLSNLNNHSKKHPNFKQSPYKRVKTYS